MLPSGWGWTKPRFIVSRKAAVGSALSGIDERPISYCPNARGAGGCPTLRASFAVLRGGREVVGDGVRGVLVAFGAFRAEAGARGVRVARGVDVATGILVSQGSARCARGRTGFREEQGTPFFCAPSSPNILSERAAHIRMSSYIYTLYTLCICICDLMVRMSLHLTFIPVFGGLRVASAGTGSTARLRSV